MKSIRLPRARTENLVIRELEDETLVYDEERDEAHCLNLSAAMVWKLCDGKTMDQQAVRSLQRQLGESVDTGFVWLAVKQLQKFHLVDRSGTVPSASRRELIVKYAPAALALPVIMSISAPTPAQAASCVGGEQPCVIGGTPCCSGSFCVETTNGSGVCVGCLPANFICSLTSGPNCCAGLQCIPIGGESDVSQCSSNIE